MNNTKVGKDIYTAVAVATFCFIVVGIAAAVMQMRSYAETPRVIPQPVPNTKVPLIRTSPDTNTGERAGDGTTRSQPEKGALPTAEPGLEKDKEKGKDDGPKLPDAGGPLEF